MTTATAPRMSLTNVVRGRLEKPLRVLLYGVEGIGKSTFGSNAPSPIFLPTEDGTAELDVERFPRPRTWSEVFEAVRVLEGEEHDRKTLVIDTLDGLEPICWQHVCDQPDEKGKRHTSIEGFGYGKGFTRALEEQRVLAAALERLQAKRQMHVVLLAHSWIKTFKNPTGDDFDRYMMKLNDKAGAFWREWVAIVLFANHETFTHERDNRAKGISTGARIIHTQRQAAWDAKNRHDLPPELPLDWEAFWEAVKAHRPKAPQKLLADIEAMMGQLDEEVARKARNSVKRANGNAAELARIADKLNAIVGISKEEN